MLQNSRDFCLDSLLGACHRPHTASQSVTDAHSTHSNIYLLIPQTSASDYSVHGPCWVLGWPVLKNSEGNSDSTKRNHLGLWESR